MLQTGLRKSIGIRWEMKLCGTFPIRVYKLHEQRRETQNPISNFARSKAYSKQNGVECGRLPILLEVRFVPTDIMFFESGLLR